MQRSAIERNKKPIGSLEIPDDFARYYLNRKDRQMRFCNAKDPIYHVFASIDKSEDAKAVWSSAYAETTGAATMKEGTKFQIDDGTAEKAVELSYAKLNTFYIGTGGYDGEFSNLKIKGLEVTVPTTIDNKNLGNALRILAVNRATNAWQVWSVAGEQLYSGAAAGGALAATVKKGADVIIDVYLYYDGDDANVYSDNLEKISADDGNNGVTITFEATPKEYKVSAGN